MLSLKMFRIAQWNPEREVYKDAETINSTNNSAKNFIKLLILQVKMATEM